MPEADEKRFMKTLLTTWGKAWHTWPDPTTAVPTDTTAANASTASPCARRRRRFRSTCRAVHRYSRISSFAWSKYRARCSSEIVRRAGTADIDRAARAGQPVTDLVLARLAR